MNETGDAPQFFRDSTYEITEGETFFGALTPNANGVVGSDRDSIWLRFDREGMYRVTLAQTGGDSTSRLAMDVLQPQLDFIGFEAEEGNDVVLNIFGPTRRPAIVINEVFNVDADYSLSMEYIGPPDPAVSPDIPFDGKRPIDATPKLETTDWSDTKKSAEVFKAGNTLIGKLTSNDVDWVGFKVKADVNYAVWYTGTGANPFVHTSVTYGLQDTFDSGAVVGKHITPEEDGTLYFGIRANFLFSYDKNQPAEYSFTLAETTLWDEVKDAPANVNTPYSMGKKKMFSGILTDGDSDWVSVRLKEGHTYLLQNNPGFTSYETDPLILNRKGNPLADQFSLSPTESDTIYTATYTGRHYLQPFDEGEYKLVLTDYGFLGNEETLDSPAGFSPYVVNSRETFTGRFHDDNDHDSIRIRILNDGFYKFTFAESDKNTKARLNFSVWGSDPLFPTHRIVEKDGQAELLFYAYAGKEYFTQLNFSGSKPLSYTFETKLISEPDLDETRDLPGRPHAWIDPLRPGDTFKGYRERSDDDFIPISAKAGQVYNIVISGAGKRLPIDESDTAVFDREGNKVATTLLDTRYFLFDAPSTDTFFVSLNQHDRGSLDQGLYQVLFEKYDGIQTGGKSNDKLSGSRVEDQMFGRAGKDSIFGFDGNDRLFGGAGRDTIQGDAGDDFLSGGRGRDILIGGDGSDRIQGGAFGDKLRGLDGDDILFGGKGADVIFGGDGNDVIRGGDNKDFLKGDEGTDILIGGAGADTLIGGKSIDALVGGDGKDKFVFNRSFGIDLDFVYDFTTGKDELHISRHFLNDRTESTILSSAFFLPKGHVGNFVSASNTETAQITFPEGGLLITLSSDHYVFVIGTNSMEPIVDSILFV